jgi:hypothetical protein
VLGRDVMRTRLPTDGDNSRSASPKIQGAGLDETKDAMKTIISVVVALVLVLALATTAHGQSSIEGYNDQGGQIQSTVGQGGSGGGEGTSPVSTTDDGGSLPFTGLDVVLLAAAGGLLAAAGLGMRRLTRAPDPA